MLFVCSKFNVAAIVWGLWYCNIVLGALSSWALISLSKRSAVYCLNGFLLLCVCLYLSIILFLPLSSGL